jgi:hypothetical protein
MCVYISVVYSRYFIGSRSNNQTNKENEREELERSGLEREGVKGLFMF